MPVHDTARQVERLLKDANAGAWPLTLQQARRAIEACGLRLALVPGPCALAASLAGDRIRVACVPEDRVDVLVARAVHELAEAIVRRLRPRADRMFAHEVASRVEWRCRAFLAALPPDDAPAPPLQEVVYVRDDTCDALGEEDDPCAP